MPRTQFTPQPTNFFFLRSPLPPAPGVSEVNEVIQKFLAQEDTHTNLENVKISTENHIAHLRETQRKLEARVEELRYTGTHAHAASGSLLS